MSDPSGAKLGITADLSALEKIAQQDFPQLSSYYSGAITHCNSVHDDLAQIMERPVYFGGDAEGPVFKSYCDLHATVVGFLTETARNLIDTGTALDKAVKYYAEIDHANSGQFIRLTQYRQVGTPAGYRPPGRRTNDNP